MPQPSLPPEILDDMVDLLRNEPEALKKCCLVSKSWIPLTRRHLFLNIRFDTEKRLRSWKETFPDPSTSPAQYTKTLIVDCLQAVTAAEAGAGSWIRGFSCVVRLEVRGGRMDIDESENSLRLFHGFSPALKTLRVTLHAPPFSQLFDLILSFPSLEDLSVFGYNLFICDGSYGLSTAVQPPSPLMTGSLNLFQKGGIGSVARWLLSLPSGIHFRNVALKCCRGEDLLLAMALVDRCSQTIESLQIACAFFSTSTRYLRPHRQLIPVSSRVGVN